MREIGTERERNRDKWRGRERDCERERERIIEGNKGRQTRLTDR